jgi:hypothetical protein
MTIVAPGQLLMFTTTDGRTVEVKKRGKHFIEPRGYADRPGTGPAGETCGSCEHVCKGKHYAKCDLSRRRWTRSRGTDVLVRSPACRKWERSTT